MGLAIDPEETPNPEGRRGSFSRDQVGGYVVGSLRGHDVTIKNVVRCLANVAGGVHHDPLPGAEYEAVKEIYDFLTAMDIHVLTQLIRPIAQVVLSGLVPLYKDVKTRSA